MEVNRFTLATIGLTMATSAMATSAMATPRNARHYLKGGDIVQLTKTINVDRYVPKFKSYFPRLSYFSNSGFSKTYPGIVNCKINVSRNDEQARAKDILLRHPITLNEGLEFKVIKKQLRRGTREFFGPTSIDRLTFHFLALDDRYTSYNLSVACDERAPNPLGLGAKRIRTRAFKKLLIKK